jgi:hypothetical protein
LRATAAARSRGGAGDAGPAPVGAAPCGSGVCAASFPGLRHHDRAARSAPTTTAQPHRWQPVPPATGPATKLRQRNRRSTGSHPACILEAPRKGRHLVGAACAPRAFQACGTTIALRAALPQPPLSPIGGSRFHRRRVLRQSFGKAIAGKPAPTQPASSKRHGKVGTLWERRVRREPLDLAARPSRCMRR